ncbi:MAG: hypothetical protein JW780_06010 [Clostridiales bacterium]|nr:hypothetical protein [Clostridiales bacterium]
MLKLTGLWEGKDKNANFLLSGKLTFSSKVLVLKNNFKEKDTDPDYFLYVSDIPKKENGDAEPITDAE